MISVCIISLSVYVCFIAMLIFGFLKTDDYHLAATNPDTRFTIVVPYRNEAQNLPGLLESISGLDYPVDLFEVILVDDASDDGFKIQEYPVTISILKNIRTSNSPKKDAISTAINYTKSEWLITTDADCVVYPNWLKTFDAFIREKKPEMIAAPVRYNFGNSFLHHFQQLDLASLQGTTMGSFGLQNGFMCNGANFAYTKSFFKRLNGFSGNDTIASGDDVFLLQKALKNAPEKVQFLKSTDAIVQTKAETSWQNVFFQHVRWASKASAYKNTFAIAAGIVALLGNLALIYALPTLLFCFFSVPLLLLVLAKLTVDFTIINCTNSFLNAKTRYFILGSLYYPFFSLAVVGFSLLGGYEWKGRKFKK